MLRWRNGLAHMTADNNIVRSIFYSYLFHLGKMAAEVDGLQLALIIFGLIQRFSNTSNYELDEHYIYPENLGFYACSSIQTKSNCYVQVNSTIQTKMTDQRRNNSNKEK